MILEGWGRYPRLVSEVFDCRTPADAAEAVARRHGVIARGNGRSYGDAALGDVATLICRGIGRMKRFDPETRLLTVEAGVMLSDILDAFIPRGYFPPVVPGTKFVTVGGMIASDVHGKNHHRDGGFGAHVASFKLILQDGEVLNCSRNENADLFFATIGGMGLTGVITEASFHMKPIETGWIHQETVVAEDLREALAALQAADESSYSVAWIDCLARGASLGRSLIFVGEHAKREQVVAHKAERETFPSPKKPRLSLPMDLPAWALNRTSVSAFNAAYFRAGVRKAGAPSLVHWNPYFFPLDGIHQWNRLYGRSGFLQHQCVVPDTNALPVLSEILERFAGSGKGSFLAVLKKLGPGTGLLSFPMPGYTLALDLPVTEDVFPLLEEIDKVIVDAGGRLYLAKDARQSRQTFEASYPQLAAFRDIRRATGGDARFASRLATRLGI
ncbi:FAD/FMN-containing dehydrogenase [Pseudorhizobium tarimense]|uniref:FAD/FMN-containing dehydrogenase n=1 Tax=Pseudorhizobium tarimense TaxID=1079109 RepID=A0ABV2H4W8_9HYPH|nr:FAD-binding oxidoreductase [Pseudorhizobium tarimense]MCJ8518803.1 FAD-binding oxidoreductase [Pseudorhizobium tarimense]